MTAIHIFCDNVDCYNDCEIIIILANGDCLQSCHECTAKLIAENATTLNPVYSIEESD